MQVNVTLRVTKYSSAICVLCYIKASDMESSFSILKRFPSFSRVRLALAVPEDSTYKVQSKFCEKLHRIAYQQAKIGQLVHSETFNETYFQDQQFQK